MPQVLHNKSRKFDRVKKFGVKKKRWEVDNEEIISLEARLQDLESVRSHAVLNDIRVLNYWRNKFMYLYQVSLQTAYRVHFLVFFLLRLFIIILIITLSVFVNYVNKCIVG